MLSKSAKWMIFTILFFALLSTITTYFSFTFSYYLFFISVPLLVSTAFFGQAAWVEISREIDEINRKKEERHFNSLNKEEQIVYVEKYPNSEVSVAFNKRKEHREYLIYAQKTLSESTEPILINTYKATCVTHEDKSFKHDDKSIYCYEWIKKSGDLLDINEIEEILKFKAEQYASDVKKGLDISMNRPLGYVPNLRFALYNDFCFYSYPERMALPFEMTIKTTPSSLSHKFSGQIDDTIYKNGALFSKANSKQTKSNLDKLDTIPEWLSNAIQDWGKFLLSLTEIDDQKTNLNDIQFDFFFCKTHFLDDNEDELFFADEMQIKVLLKDDEDGEWYEGDQIYFPELICGDDSDHHFQSCIFYNTPASSNTELGSGWSNTGGLNFEAAVGFLKKMPVINYELLADEERNSFKYFSSAKIRANAWLRGLQHA